jgi:DNA repair ATPase RecN
MDNLELKRKEDFENLSKVAVVVVKLEEMSKRLDSIEGRFVAELEKISLRLEKVESLRERLAEVEAITNNHDCDIKELRDEYNKQVQNNIDFFRRLTIEFALVVVGLLANILFTLLKK